MNNVAEISIILLLESANTLPLVAKAREFRSDHRHAVVGDSPCNIHLSDGYGRAVVWEASGRGCGVRQERSVLQSRVIKVVAIVHSGSTSLRATRLRSGCSRTFS